GRWSAHAGLGERYREPAFGAVVRGVQQARPDGCPAGLLYPALEAQVQLGQPPRSPLMQRPEVLRAAQAHRVRPDEGDPIPPLPEHWRGPCLRALQEPRHPDHGSGQDRLPEGLIVKGDIAADYRDVQGMTGLGDPGHRLFELPQDLRALGRAEVEAV